MCPRLISELLQVTEAPVRTFSLGQPEALPSFNKFGRDCLRPLPGDQPQLQHLSALPRLKRFLPDRVANSHKIPEDLVLFLPNHSFDD